MAEGLPVSLKIVALISVLILQVAPAYGSICDRYILQTNFDGYMQYFRRHYYDSRQRLMYLSTYNCTGRNLTDLPEEIDRDVAAIYLADNSITHLKSNMFAGILFSRLTILYLNNNNITTIDNGAFNGLEALEKLVLSGNNIICFPPHIFNNMSILAYLSLDRNNLILPDGIFKELKLLTILKFSQCNLTTLPSEVYSMKWRELDISYNNLKDVSLNFTARTLNISNNNNNNVIHFINNTKLVSLEVLDLSNNSLDMPDNFIMQIPNVYRLLLGSCKLTGKIVSDILNDDINSSTPNPIINLEIISLEYNNISSLPPNIFTRCRLESLYLNNNHINFAENSIFLNSSTLKSLNLQWNAITNISEITFRGTPYLQNLLLDYNYLEIIDGNAFHELHELYFISLIGNRIKVIHPDLFLNNINLNLLELSDNPLDISKDSSLLDTLSLRFIELNRCNISQLPSKLFDHMPNLYSISLINNSLSTANPKTFESLKFLEKVDIKGNPLVCDGHLKLLLHFFIKRDMEIKPAECVSPKGDWRMLEHMYFDIDSSDAVVTPRGSELDDSSMSREVLKSELVTPHVILKNELNTQEQIANQTLVTSDKISKKGLSKGVMFALLVVGVLIGVGVGLTIDIFIFRKYQCFSRYQVPTEQFKF